MADKTASHWPITLTNGAASLLGIFLPLVLVRLVTLDDMGRYNIFFLYAGLVPALFLVSGLSNGLYYWAGKYPEAKAEVRQSWTLLLIASVGFSILGFVFSPLYFRYIKIPRIDLNLFLLCIPCLLAAGFLEDLMIARGSIWMGSFFTSGFKVFQNASLVLVAWWTRRMEWILGIFVAGTALRVLVGWLALRGTGEIKLLFSRERSMSALRYAMPVSIAALGSLAINHVDQMILSFRLSPIEFTFYAMGCLTLPPLDIFETSVNRVLIPQLSRAFTTENFKEAGKLYAGGMIELFSILLPATMGMVIYAQPIVRILFTDRYLPAAHYLRFFALTYLLLSFPGTVVARSRGDGRWILTTTLIFAVVGATVAWFATVRWGAMGALGTVLLSQLSLRFYALAYIRKALHASKFNFIPVKGLILQSSLALTAAAASILLRPLFSDTRVWFFLTGPLFTLIYFGLMYSINIRRLHTGLSPIRILELSQTLGLGGLERMVYLMSETLHESWGFDVKVATYDDGRGQPSLAAKFRESGIPLIQWQKGKGFSFSSVFRLVHLIFSERIRILHVHDLGPLIYGSLAKVLTLRRVKLILTVHTLLDIQHHPRHRRYYSFFLRFPDKIVAVSTAVQKGLLDLGVPKERIEVIQNGVKFLKRSIFPSGSEHQLALRRKVSSRLLPEFYDSRWAISLARIHPGKGHDVLLDLWNALPAKTRSGMVLFFVGQETDASCAVALRKRAAGLPDGERIVFAGPSEHPEEWIQCSDVFVSGSLHEGMPLAPLEAAGSGLPVLLSDIEGHAYLKPWARYFNPREPDEGAREITKILKDLESDAENKFFQDQWTSASPLREQWGTFTMTASYANIFRSGASS